MEVGGCKTYPPLNRLKDAVKRRDVKTTTRLLNSSHHLKKSHFDKLMHWLFHNTNGDLKLQPSIIEIMKLLLDLGANVNYKTVAGYTLLHLAIENRMEQVVDLLISRNADLDVRDAYDNPIMHFMIKRESIKLKKRLNPKRFRKEKRRSIDFIRCMIQKGLDVDCKNDKGDTALHYILKKYKRDFAKILLEYSKNVDMRDKDGNTALDIITGYYWDMLNEDKDDGIVRALLVKGANVHNFNENGSSPLITAIRKRSLDLLKIFELQGVDFCRSYGDGNLLHYFIKSTADVNLLHFYIVQKDVKIDDTVFRILIDQGCDVNGKDYEGMTPLHFAVRRDKAKIVEKLLENGANINSQDFIRGYTPLHEAVVSMYKNLVTLMVEKGADVNAKTNKGETSLHLVKSRLEETEIARDIRSVPSLDGILYKLASDLAILVQGRQNHMVSTLISHGAHIDIRDDDGVLPLQAAIQRQDTLVMNALLRCGADVNDNVHVLGETDYRPISNTMSEHLIKLQVAGLPVDDKLKHLLVIDSDFAQIYQDCLVEVEGLKNHKITQNTSLYGFLCMNRNSTCAYVNNEKLKELLNSATFEQQFPMYHGLIASTYFRAVDRQVIIEPAKRAWLDLTDVEMPDLCIHEIVSHLSNMDLRVMIEGASENVMETI